MGTIKVDFWYDADCPNAPVVRSRLAKSLRKLTAQWTLQEHRDGGVLSPTVLVNGEDVMHLPIPRGRGCRLDLPTTGQIDHALNEQRPEPSHA